MKKWLFVTAAVFPWFSIFPVYAAPTCTNTMTAASGVPIAGSFLVASGSCVLAGDKIFGTFTISPNITAAGSATFTFMSPTTDVTVGFLGTSITSGTSGALNYEVEIDAPLANGFLIDDLQKDFSFNAISPGTAASATLTGLTTPAPSKLVGGDTTSGSFACTRSLSAGGVSSGTCPQTGFFSPLLTNLMVNETITAGANTTVTALTDTVSQAVPGVPEPASLAMLGTALSMLGFLGWRRRQS